VAQGARAADPDADARRARALRHRPNRPGDAYGKNFPEQQAADGQRFPTLDEVLALAKSAGVRVNIETKITPSSGATVVDPETFARLVVGRVAAAGWRSARPCNRSTGARWRRSGG
jgi:hypothetical protein